MPMFCIFTVFSVCEIPNMLSLSSSFLLCIHSNVWTSWLFECLASLCWGLQYAQCPISVCSVPNLLPQTDLCVLFGTRPRYMCECGEQSLSQIFPCSPAKLTLLLLPITLAFPSYPPLQCVCVCGYWYKAELYVVMWWAVMCVPVSSSFPASQPLPPSATEMTYIVSGGELSYSAPLPPTTLIVPFRVGSHSTSRHLFSLSEKAGCIVVSWLLTFRRRRRKADRKKSPLHLRR